MPFLGIGKIEGQADEGDATGEIQEIQRSGLQCPRHPREEYRRKVV